MDVGPNTAGPAGPSLETLWSNYRQWFGEAGERYQRDIERISRMPGLSEEGVQTALTERRTEYEGELESLRQGPTYGALERYYAQVAPAEARVEALTGRPAQAAGILTTSPARGMLGPAPETPSLEEYFTARYGGPEDGPEETIAETEERTRAPRGGSELDFAALGPRRPWWAIA